MPLVDDEPNDREILDHLPLRVDGDTDQIRRLRGEGRVLSVFGDSIQGENLYAGPHRYDTR